MLRSRTYSLLGWLGLLIAGSTASAQTAFPSMQPGYQPNFRYQYGYGVYPSYYYNASTVPVVRPFPLIYTVEMRRGPWDFWIVVARTYNQAEANRLAIYWRNQGFQVRMVSTRF